MDSETISPDGKEANLYKGTSLKAQPLPRCRRDANDVRAEELVRGDALFCFVSDIIGLPTFNLRGSLTRLNQYPVVRCNQYAFRLLNLISGGDWSFFEISRFDGYRVSRHRLLSAVVIEYLVKNCR